ncbi:30 kDa salivary gland allergen Aed a 3-like [Folsomia candida]|uniref:30 kDa salivary gland allergen Aed a 3-like n=1 Tax=Folsomia candida TaxID=158441 RepID=UPI00160540AF|nr:30 kDa salivary gland allergen Aed a 3-like [Folsomia candida]
MPHTICFLDDCHRRIKSNQKRHRLGASALWPLYCRLYHDEEEAHKTEVICEACHIKIRSQLKDEGTKQFRRSKPKVRGEGVILPSRTRLNMRREDNDARGAEEEDRRGAEEKDCHGAEEEDRSGAEEEDRRGGGENDAHGAEEEDRRGGGEDDAHGAEEEDHRSGDEDGAGGAEEDSGRGDDGDRGREENYARGGDDDYFCWADDDHAHEGKVDDAQQEIDRFEYGLLDMELDEVHFNSEYSRLNTIIIMLQYYDSIFNYQVDLILHPVMKTPWLFQ